MSETQVPVYETLDLYRHAVIQASAGTGKTYTVERLVLRYLLQADSKTQLPRFKLDDILLVTFTEKATGELKQRIRSFIGTAIEKLRQTDALTQCDTQSTHAQLQQLGLPIGPKDSVLRPNLLLPHLENQLQSFDRAQIFTIHGFCSKVIKEHAFYCNMPMQLTMSDGKEILSRVLRDYLNTATDLDLDSVKDWMRTTTNTLNQMVEVSDLVADIPTISEQDVAQANATLLQLEKEFSEQLIHFFSLTSDEYQALLTRHNVNAKGKAGAVQTLKTNEQKHFVTGLQTLGELSNSETAIEHFDTWLNTYLPKWKNKSSNGLLSATAIQNLKDNYDRRPHGWRVVEIQERLQASFALLKTLKQQQTLIDTQQKHLECARQLNQQIDQITALFQTYSEEKLNHSELTFNDMIKIVSQQISHHNSQLKTQLQSQYKVGIVDEFQDTSRRQWDIFRSIFMDDNPDEARTLMVVGDEKQSIYSFQGSEVSTCLQAIRYITHECSGQHCTLSTNYRSTPALIEAYNALFRNASWFGDYDSNREPNAVIEKTGLSNGYQDVLAGEDQDQTKEKPIWLCDLHNFEKLEHKKAALNNWTVSAIIHLIDDCGVSPSDIAILVEKNAEADEIISTLRKRGKPVSRIKEAGLFNSRFNLNMIAALEAIHDHKNPEKIKKLLLSVFFTSVTSNTPLSIGIAEQWQQAERLLFTWHRYALQRNWSGLLRALFEDSQLYTHLSPLDKRAVMAFRQLRSYALKRLVNQDDDLASLSKRLRSLHKGEITESEEENIFHKETSSEAIQMLTLHKSKGLEFDYVFIPSGSSGFRTKGASDGFVRKFSDKGMHLALYSKDMGKSDHEQVFACQEKRRLWYVGVTRAKKLLALANWGTWSRQPKTCAYKDFLQPCLDDNSNQAYFKRFELTQGYDQATLSEMLLHSKIPRRTKIANNELTIPANLVLSEYKTPIRERVWINESASSLMQHTALRSSHKSGDEGLLNAPSSATLPNKNLLPKGATTGNMLHDILEKIHFSQGTELSEKDIVKKYFAQLNDKQIDDYAKRCKTLLASVKAVPIQVKAYNQCFTLNDIQLSRCVAEPQFHFSIDNNGYLFPADPANIAGWVQGFIDLMFEHQGRYYILDWKSNALTHYSQDHLNEAMNANQYTLQAALYMQALRAFLQHRYPNQDIRSKLGGAIYVFLRARENEEEGKGESGIWFATPEDLEQMMPATAIQHKFIEKLSPRKTGGQ